MMLNGIIHFFSDRLLDEDNQRARRSARIAVITCLLTTVFAVFYVVVSYLIDFEAGMWSQGLTAILFIVLCFVFKHSKMSVNVFGNLYSLICYQTIALLPYFSGGLHEHSIIFPWFAIIPAIALLLTNVKSAWIWFAISGSTIVAYAFIDPDLMTITYDRRYELPFSVAVYFGLLLITMVVNATFKGHKDKALFALAEAKDRLHEKTDALQTAYKQLDLQNQKVLSSINYSKRIQDAMLPDVKRIKELFPESFIIYKPKDVVSGDFYWVEEIGDKIYVAAVDCTGHGVPGAFMSLIGNNILNEALSKGITVPSEILSYLNDGVNACLNQDQTNNHDGMDMVICMIDKEAKIMRFSGAQNPLIYVTENAQGEKILNRIRGDKHSVGGKVMALDPNAKKEFVDHTLSLEKPIEVYLFSDGFQDQYNSSYSKKFTQKRMRNYFLDHSDSSMKVIQHGLEEELSAWMGGAEQIDDILVMGMRLDLVKEETVKQEMKVEAEIASETTVTPRS